MQTNEYIMVGFNPASEPNPRPAPSRPPEIQTTVRETVHFSFTMQNAQVKTVLWAIVEPLSPLHRSPTEKHQNLVCRATFPCDLCLFDYGLGHRRS